MKSCWDCQRREYCEKGILFKGKILGKDVSEECEEYE